MGVGLTGGCNCGAIRYSIETEPETVMVCHCSNCRRQSGSAFSVNLLVPSDKVDISGDAVHYFDRQTDSGNLLLRSFCGRCGSPICSRRDLGAALTVIKVGTLDEPDRFAPTVQIWTDSALPWVKLDEDVASMPGNPEKV